MFLGGAQSTDGALIILEIVGQRHWAERVACTSFGRGCGLGLGLGLGFGLCS